MAVGKGVLVTESVNTLTDDETETLEQLFGPISLIERVDTAHMNIAMVVAGCAPAFTDMYIEALGDAGVQYGLQRATGLSGSPPRWSKVSARSTWPPKPIPGP